MFFSLDLANLLFYCAQQLGITLGVGAETIMLAAYLIAMRDGVVDEKESQYARAIKRVLSAALWCIVVSGIGITVLHLMAGESAIIFTPAYLFKWLLVVLAAALTGLRKAFPISLVEGVIGGTWYALFLVHILAPVTSWFNLGTLYVVWLVGFVICWEGVVLLRKDKKVKIDAAPEVKKVEAPIVTPAPAPIPPPPPAPKPTIVLAPDLPRVAPVPPPQPMPPPVIPVVPSAVPQPIPQPVPVMEPATPLAANRVTDTPFLPAVPALQPIPTTPEMAMAAATAASVQRSPEGVTLTPPVDMLAPAPAPTTGTAPTAQAPLAPLNNMAINVMPKSPADIPAKQ